MKQIAFILIIIGIMIIGWAVVDLIIDSIPTTNALETSQWDCKTERSHAPFIQRCTHIETKEACIWAYHSPERVAQGYAGGLSCTLTQHNH